MRKKLLAFAQVLLAFCLAAQFMTVSVSAYVAWTKNGDGKYYNDQGDVIKGVTARGIDISEYQGEIDWEKLYREEFRTGKLDFVIIRCGYGDDWIENGVPQQDDRYFYRNADACTRLGIPFGVYLFSYANTLEHAYSEVDHVLRMVKGYTLSYPIYFDVEWTEGMNGKGANFFKQICDIFCGGLQKYGYEVGVYSFRSWFTNNDYLGKIDYEGNNWGKWIAEFGPRLNYYESFDIWQCTSSGSVAGIGGRCDINYSFIERRTTDHCYLTFDGNGGSVSRIKPMHVNRGQKYSNLPVPTRSGYVFDGWYTSAKGGTKVTADTIVPEAGKQTLYAHWKEPSYTVTLKLSGMRTSGGGTVQEVKPGQAISPVTLHADADFKLPLSLTLPAGMTYVRTDEKTAVLSGTPTKDMTITIIGVENERLDAPDASKFTVSDVSAAGKKDGSLKGLTQDMEYAAGDGVWKEVTAEEAKNGLSGLPAGKILVRMKATAGNRASTEISLTVRDVAAAPDKTRFTVIPPVVAGAPGAVLGMDSTLEYSLDNGKTWNFTYDDRVADIPDWGGIRIRVRETEDCLPGESLTLHVCSFETEGAVSFADTAIIGLVSSETYLVDGKKVKANGDGMLSLGDDWYGKTVTICADVPDSVEFTLTVPERPDAPVLNHTDETVSRKSDGTITGLTAEMEYSLDGKKWNKVTKRVAENGMTDLRNGTYYVRYAAVRSGTKQAFAGKQARIEIEAGRKLIVTYRAEGFDDVQFEISYEGVLKEIPELPARDDCVMDQSYWSVDLSGTAITEDVEVTAVYQLTRAAIVRNWFSKNAVLLIAACGAVVLIVGGAIVLTLRKKKAKATAAAGEAAQSAAGADAEKTEPAEKSESAEKQAAEQPEDGVEAKTEAAEKPAETAEETLAAGTGADGDKNP